MPSGVRLALVFALACQAESPVSDDPTRLRDAMVLQQIEARGVRHRLTLEAMRRVPRHEFVPAELRAQAYADQPLTDKEIEALVAVLQRAAEASANRMPRDYGMGLFTSGVAGAVLVFGSCSLIWRRRKRESVNQSIYDRQMKSS